MNRGSQGAQPLAKSRHVGVFGGSFDPVHNGHLAIALAALEQVPLDRVTFVPARRSPLKDEAPRATEAERLEMLELATRDEPRFAVSRLELERTAPSYTVDTLEALATSGGRLYVILGADAARDLPRWRRPDRVRELATIVLARRALRAEVPLGSGHGDPAAILLDTPLLDISARELRERAARGRSLRYLVPDAVWRYIEQRGVYRGMRSSAS